MCTQDTKRRGSLGPQWILAPHLSILGPEAELGSMSYAGNQFVWNVLCVLSRLRLEFNRSDRVANHGIYLKKCVCWISESQCQETVSSYMHDYDHAHMCARGCSCMRICVCVLCICVFLYMSMHVCVCVCVVVSMLTHVSTFLYARSEARDWSQDILY